MAPVLAAEMYEVYGMKGHVYNKLFIFVRQPFFLKIIDAAFFFDAADFTAVFFVAAMPFPPYKFQFSIFLVP